jgi:hypothetical protein
LLVEPSGLRSISTAILAATCLFFHDSYKVAGEIMTPAAVGGYAPLQRQVIYNPIESITNISACRACGV